MSWLFLLPRVDVEIFAIIVVIMLVYDTIRKGEHFAALSKTFLRLAYFIIFMLFVEIMSGITENATIATVSIIILFSLLSIVPILWYRFSLQTINAGENCPITCKIIFILIMLVNVILAVTSPYTQLYFYFINDNFQRGPLFFLSTVIFIVLTCLVYIYILKNKKYIDNHEFLPLMLFPVPTIIAAIIQTLLDLNIVWGSFTFSLLILYFNIQYNAISRDSFTGMFNRRRLMSTINKKILLCSSKTFSGILIDIDDFKKINDTYGHIEGDKVLETVASILITNLRSNDFISRIGGDEFVILLDINCRDKLKATIDILNKGLKDYNESSGKKYQISWSSGYDIYDPQNNMSSEDFINHIDTIMYKEKNIKKGIA